MKKIETLADAKKKLKSEAIISAIIYAVIAVLAFIFLGVLGIFVVVALLVLLGYIILSEKKKIKRNFCPDCSTKYDYETDVRWSVTNSRHITRQSSSSHSNTASLRAEDKALVHCECVCRGCGKVTEFHKNITICKYYSDGSTQRTNLREYMRRYFKL